MYDVLVLLPLQQSLEIGSYVKMLVRRVLSVYRCRITQVPVPRSRNIYGVSGLYHLQQSLEIGSYVKMLMHEVLPDRYRITQETFQYHEVET